LSPGAKGKPIPVALSAQRLTRQVKAGESTTAFDGELFSNQFEHSVRGLRASNGETLQPDLAFTREGASNPNLNSDKELIA